MDMSKPFAAQDFDALDAFEMEDDFIDAVAAPRLDPTPFITPPATAMAGPAPTEEAYNPVGRMVAETETAVAAVMMPEETTPTSPVPVDEVYTPPVPLVAVTPEAPVSALTAYEPAGLPVGPGAVEVSIPRIAVHVFAERQDTLAAAERAGQDRRMSRATTQIRIGGVAAAIEAYQSEPTPPLIVVESMKDAQTLLWEIDQLAEVCDAGTKVVIIGATNDILLFRELMRRGVSEYLVAPVQPLQLISAIGGLFADPAQPFVGRSIAFVGARGGAGASAVAHNTAYAMSERIGVNTVIVDYDLPFGTAGLDFNQDPLGGVADALSQPDRLDATLLDRMMVRCTDKLSLFAAPATLDGDWDIQPDAFEEVTSRIRSTAPFVVLDLPHLWSGWMRKTLISADEVVIVATPDLASLRNAKNMIDLIKQGRPNDAPPRLILNQVGMPGRPEIPAKDFGTALGVHPSLIIPFDAKVFGAAANNGQMIVDSGAKTKAAEAFETLAQIVSRRELPTAPAKGKSAPAKKGGSLLASLFSKKR